MTDLHRPQQHVVITNGIAYNTDQNCNPDFFEPDDGQPAPVLGPTIFETLRSDDDEAQRIAACLASARRESREFAHFQHDEQKSISEMEKQLRRLESDAEKRAGELEKSVERERRAELKEQRRLAEQEGKTVKMAQELAARQKVAREWEEAERNLAEARRVEVTQLAEQIVAKKEQLRSLAEQRASQLEAMEEAAKRHARDLDAHWARDQRDASAMKKELRASEKASKRSADELESLVVSEEREIDIMSDQLERLEEEARIAEQLREKHAAERAGVERRVKELAEAEEMERQWAQGLREKQGANEAAIETQQQLLAANERLLHDTKFLAKRKAEERRSSKDCLITEQEALEMVNKLAVEQETKRSADELSRLIEQEKSELGELSEQVAALDEEACAAESLYVKHAAERAELERRALALATAEEKERVRARDFREAQKANEDAIKHHEELLSKNELKLHDAELLAARRAEERRMVEACAKKCLENEREALEKARRLAIEQEAQRRAALETVADLTAEEQEARRRAFDLEQRELGRLSQVAGGEEPDVVDVYQHSRYAAGQRQPELVSSVEHVEQHAGRHKSVDGPSGRRGSIVEKLAEGIKHIF